jgi:hypothetical protein
MESNETPKRTTIFSTLQLVQTNMRKWQTFCSALTEIESTLESLQHVIDNNTPFQARLEAFVDISQ